MPADDFPKASSHSITDHGRPDAFGSNETGAKRCCLSRFEKAENE